MSTLLFFAVISLAHSEWISHPDNTMCRVDTEFAIGSYNDKIYLLGGSKKPRQQTIYDTKEDSFVFYKSGFVPITNKISGEAQFWTQMGFNLYILDDLEIQNNKISVFNMEDNLFKPQFAEIPESASDGNGVACMTSSPQFNKIFINGGISILDSVAVRYTQVLDIASMDWSFAPEMQIARKSHSCIIHPDNNVLYSIGGYSTDSLVDTIEKLQISEDFNENTQWTYLAGILPKATQGGRSFINGNYIVIISGYRNAINILDITNDLITLHEEPLAEPTGGYSAVIMVNDVMYSFGGGPGMDEWQSDGMLPPTKTTPSPITSNNPAITASPTTTKPNVGDITTTGVKKESGGGSSKSRGGMSPAAGDLLLCLFIVGLICGVGIVAYIVTKKKGAKTDSFTQMDDGEDDKFTLVSDQDKQYANGNVNVDIPTISPDLINKDDNEEKVDMVIRPQDAHMNNDF